MQINTITPRRSGEITSKVGVKKEQASFSQAMKAAESSTKQDSVKIANRSISQKLEDLKVEFEKTDFTGMSQAQKLNFIETRYDEAFPDFDAMIYFDPENYDKIVTQYENEANNLGIKWRNIEKRVCQERGLKWNTLEAANSPSLKQLMHSYALNVTMTWDSIFESVSDNDKLTQEQRTDILKDMEVQLNNLKY